MKDVKKQRGVKRQTYFIRRQTCKGHSYKESVSVKYK